MTTKRTRTRVDPLVRRFIEQESRANRTATAHGIRARVQRLLKRHGFDLPLPKDRTIQVIAKKVREVPGRTADDLWSLGVRDRQIRPEHNGDLLAAWKVSLIKGAPLTIRQARWVSRLRSVLRGGSTEDLLRWATVYEGYERSAELAGQHLDTIDLDAELAFKVWKSPNHQWEYDQAVLSGEVPASRRESEEAWMLEDFFFAEARDFLLQVAGAQTKEPSWWSYAEAVVCFWLRAISAKVGRWDMLDRISLEELGEQDREEWNSMGLRLAELVKAKAQESGMALSVEHPSTSDIANWKPAEVLQEIGYPG